MCPMVPCIVGIVITTVSQIEVKPGQPVLDL